MAALPAERYAHITLDKAGIPWVAGTTLKVVEIVMAQQAHGWSPEEIYFQHPDLSMAQIHGALAYYWDHAEAIDADLARRDASILARERQARPSALAERLRGLRTAR